MMTFGSLFAGIGGFDLGLERAGMKCQWQVEINPFCRKILAKHWPRVKKYDDIKKTGKHNLEPVDLICGGFPCQPFSLAGKRRGQKDDNFLWPEMARIIEELNPTWVVCENVPGLINMELDQMLTDLENKNYETGAFVIPACGIGAKHFRYRVWIVAHTKLPRLEGLHKESWRKCLQSIEKTIPRHNWEATPKILRRADGFSRKLDKPLNYKDRIEALGNAVVPQLVEGIGVMIKAAQYNTRNKRWEEKRTVRNKKN